jgi:hypothetical protein
MDKKGAPMSTTLRKEILRFAKEHPEFRGHLLPVLKLAIEFPTEDARREYLKEHPKANPRNHTVKKQSPGPKSQGERWGDRTKALSEKGTTPKDRMRVNDIVRKSKGDIDKEISLTRTMAKAITDYEKAFRRGMAAEGENFQDMAEIFYDRAEELFHASSPKSQGTTAPPKVEPKKVEPPKVESKKPEPKPKAEKPETKSDSPKVRPQVLEQTAKAFVDAAHIVRPGAAKVIQKGLAALPSDFLRAAYKVQDMAKKIRTLKTSLKTSPRPSEHKVEQLMQEVGMSPSGFSTPDEKWRALSGAILAAAHAYKKGADPFKESSHSGNYPKAVVKVMDKHSLTDDDAAAVKDFRKKKPAKSGVKKTEAQLMQEFLKNAKPETKERMKGMSPAEFMQILGAIMEDEDGEGGTGKKAFDEGLRGDLIRLAHAVPEMRKHLVPMLREGSYSSGFAATYSGKIAAVLAAICSGETQSGADWKRALADLQKAVSALKQQLDDMFFDDPDTQAQQAQDFNEEFRRDLAKRLKPVL